MLSAASLFPDPLGSSGGGMHLSGHESHIYLLHDVQ